MCVCFTCGDERVCDDGWKLVNDECVFHLEELKRKVCVCMCVCCGNHGFSQTENAASLPAAVGHVGSALLPQLLLAT